LGFWLVGDNQEKYVPECSLFIGHGSTLPRRHPARSGKRGYDEVPSTVLCEELDIRHKARKSG
jgi:hypothetical protein